MLHLQDIARRMVVQHDVGVSFIILTWIFVLARMYVRTRVLKAVGKDDYTLLLAMVSFLKTYSSFIHY